MEFRGGGGQDEGMGGYNPSTPIKNSAFSKPTLSPSSTLLISPRGFPHPGGARNGNCAFEIPSSSSSPLNPLHSRALDSTEPPPATNVQYKECLRNHAASIGGHVVDGCGEFMPGSGDDAMKCDACGCHRSFHRKDSYADNRVPLLLPLPPPSSATESSSEELNAVAAHHRPAAVASASAPRKRFRTKFTAEQKERMLGFAESVGWRIQRQDEATVEQFCTEVGVKRQVLKVWMHNNKHSIRKHIHQLPQQQQQQQHHHHQQEHEQEQEQAQDQDQDQQQTHHQQQQMQEE
ncbi:zinc-finger homeodomain protein 5-like isoform X1 [Dioscorea cayenensis subsp. rotundata]|uniref:Zinc-finger homeodomain protein 5-like isoform X1 n=1 Tax=Dioscorea cayennensis subsp. rotundata TaxID=55577 RepID=A0AB40B6N7_DIOCR|nr:zinc-finger homeodomain protein 5-like isoform X1 [Dioscorea cayenensis subsp. rotundata]